ncbi:hypothetical protein SUGI_0769730 [Cryptomeria japonica]|nr:hypothetical protein SUGI_0769730 [Cryptomeria japonica]
MRPTGFDGNLSFLSAKYCSAPLNSDVESRDVKPGTQTWSTVNLQPPVFQSKDSMDGVELRRLINLTAVISRKALAKSRDPRRRVTESEFCTVDLNTQPCQIESSIITKEQAEEVSLDRKHKADADLIEDCNHKRRRKLSAHHLFPNNFPVMMSGSGAWLKENTVIPSSSDWDQTLEMEVDSTGTIIRPNDLQTDYNSIFDADIEHSIIENGNLNKRLKTESFYQANLAVGPAYESNQLQSNPIDGNLSFKIQSQSEEEKAGRSEVDITDQGQQNADA